MARRRRYYAYLDFNFSAFVDTGAAPLGLDPAGNPIYPGAIRHPLTGNVFPGNVIRRDRISAVSRQIADMYRQSYAPQVDRLSQNSALTNDTHRSSSSGSSPSS